MDIIRTVAELRHGHVASEVSPPTPSAWCQRWARSTPATLPSSRAARASCSHVAVSIFVNPTQFGPNEDYARYPRTFDDDCALAKAEGADVIFAPSVEELYPPGATTFVEVGDLGDRLDGASRPGHFRGVATVVAKLLIAAEPDRAFFGQKDAAQVCRDPPHGHRPSSRI